LVLSGHDKTNRTPGEIVGVGARIVEYPERLRKRPDILIWGREIIVRLPPENRFLLGEKVRISLVDESAQATRASVSEASATGRVSPAPVGGVSDIRFKKVAAAGFVSNAVELPGLEASGILYLDDLDKFLVVDDETRKSPSLYLVDSAGWIDAELPIGGLDDMADMEAITADSVGAIYVLSSQSHNKKGKLSKARTLLVKVGRQGRNLKLMSKVYLRDALDAAARANPGQEWASFLLQGLDEGTLDIEGMALDRDGLLLGFKAPLLKGKAVILMLRGLDGLMADPMPDAKVLPPALSLWRALDLKNPETGISCGIADMHKSGRNLYVLSTGTLKEKAGAAAESHVGDLWAFDVESRKLQYRRGFGGKKVEGLSLHAPSQSFYVVVDNGGESPSQLLKAGANP
jgi:hypothetical protein